MSTQTTTFNPGASATFTASAYLVGGAVTAVVAGSEGETGATGAGTGGPGAWLAVTVPASASEQFTVYVGDHSGSYGYHQGGPGGTTSDADGNSFNGGRGGASSALVGPSGLLVEAGGGGAAGGSNGPYAGGPGGAAGGSPAPGGAGSPSGGGAGGQPFGSSSTGGSGLNGPWGAGGGGGGGNQGGNGGAGATAAASGGGGAGGSDFVAASVSIQSSSTNADVGQVRVSQRVADAPLVPTLNRPAANAYLDAAAVGVTFGWAYNPGTDSGSQQSYALRVKQAGGQYWYWNATSGASASAAVWNSSASQSASIPARYLADGNTYNWSVATAESYYGLEGPFASDSTFVATAMPTVTVSSPGASTSSATPVVAWSETLGSGDSQTAFRVVVYTQAQTQQAGFLAGSTAGVVDSGTVSSAATSWQVPAGSALTPGSYAVYVQVVETGGVTSAWTSQSFTVQFDPPATPAVTVTVGSGYDASLYDTGVSYDGNPLQTVTVTVDCPDNLLSADDASLEGSIGSWGATVSSSVARVSAAADDGSYALAITSQGASAVGGVTGFYDVQPGIVYAFSAALHSPSATGRSGRVAVNWCDSGGSVITAPSGSVVTVPTSGWATATLVSTAPSNAVKATVEPFVSGCAGPLATPAAPTVTPTGTAGTTAYYYTVVGHNAYGTVTSAEGSTTTGASALSTTNYNALSWTAETGIASWDVWRGTTAGGENTLVASGLTGTSYNDTGGGSSGTMPTANTTGETHYVDEIGMWQAPTVPAWTRGGLVGNETVSVVTSDDGGATWLPMRTLTAVSVPANTQQVSGVDAEAIPGVKRIYQATVSAPVTSPAATVTATSAQVSATVSATSWWLVDPVDPRLSIPINVVGYPTTRHEQLTTHYPLGSTYPTVASDVVNGTDGNLQVETAGSAEWNNLNTALGSQRVKWLISPYGDGLYVRCGAASPTMGISGQVHQTSLQPSTPQTAYRTATVQYAEVARP